VNVARWMERRSFIEPDALTLKEGSVSLNNAEFYGRMLRATSFLNSHGISPDDRVAVLLYNSSLFLELFFATARLGAIFVPLNYRLASMELDYMLKNSGSRLLVFDPDFSNKVEGTEVAEKVQILFPSGKDGLAELPFDSEPGAKGAPDEKEVSADTPLLILYTSGTTGRPKGATLTHGNVFWNAVMHLNEGLYREKALANAPFFHVGGLNAIATHNLHSRGSLIIERSFDARRALELIERERVTCMFGAPTMLEMITREPLFETADLSSVRYFMAGAAPVPINLIEKFHKRGIRIRQGLGLTECAPAVCLLHDQYALLKPGSCGKEFFHLEVRIVDEGGKDVAQGELGEIIVKGPNVMIGYWGDPESTLQTLRDGWLYTGDLGRKDSDGFIYVVDRKKDMIISGGENIYPAEVESVLVQHGGVAEVAVIGIPDSKWGEVPLAYIVPEPGTTPQPEELMKFCNSRIAKYKIPRQFRFVRELPKIVTGKIDKKVLRQLSL